jgi:hypothetical protein
LFFAKQIAIAMCPRRHVFIRLVYVELRRNYSGVVGVRWCGTELFTVVAWCALDIWPFTLHLLAKLQ